MRLYERSRQTRLQVSQLKLAHAFSDARERLTPDEYLCLLAIAIEIVSREVGRCTRWDDEQERSA